MKILHVINNLGAGGAEKLLTDILPLMNKKGHEVTVVISNDTANVPRFEQLLDDAGVGIHKMNKGMYNPLQVLSLIRLIRKQKYDVVHAHLFPTQYWLAFATLFISNKTKLVKTEHSVFNERKQYRILRPIEKFVYGRYDVTIAITAAVQENLMEWLGKKTKVETIYNGVNLGQIREQKQNALSKVVTVFSEANFNILMVGRFDGIHKDQGSLVEAFSKLQKKNTELFFAGDGPGLSKIKELTTSLGILDRVHFLGVRTDVYALMSGADLNVLSTNTEGLSGVALESMASGKPFIGSDVTGVNDIVPNANFLFPKQNPTQLSQRIDELIHNESQRLQLVQEATTHIDSFDIKHMVHNYLSLYNQLLRDN